MRLSRLSAVVGAALLWLVFARGATAQTYPVRVIENPPFEAQSAFVAAISQMDEAARDAEVRRLGQLLGEEN